MENFKASVPAELQTKMHALARTILENWRNMVHKGECIMSPETVAEIEGNYRSGWIPHQDGGFTVNGYYQNDEDSSYHFTEKQTEFAHEQAKDCFAAFLSDNELDSDTEWDNLTDEQQESLYEYEREWFEEALLQYEIFCNGYSGSFRDSPDGPTVTVRVSVNYKDAPYYREKYAEDIKEEVFTVEEFMQAELSAIMEQFKI